MGRELSFTVAEEERRRGVQSVLRGRGVSRRLLTKLKNEPGGILLNGQSARGVDTCKPGDVLAIRIPADPVLPTATPLPLDILYQDADMLIVNKPAKLAMHPTHGVQGATLAGAVTAHLEQTGSPGAFRAIGRLDRSTSGLVLCALHSYAAFALAQSAKKTYSALVLGEYHGSGTINRAIYRPKPHCTLRACREANAAPLPGDLPAITHWQSLACADGVSYLVIRLETGRTHQIRTHFAALGTPLLGDDYYGAPALPAGRAFLHCGQMQLTHPVDGRMLSFSAPLPEDMAQIVNKM
ncbi:MAG: RluA family pseudouridine synthase [Oscillospiraceae bacterium]|jgi:23S rRNA pseudouridine1911/1915/1917 synthase|nr:RluA family pseudouridine synthase [Oscillospiraceae bacterium]